MLLELEDDELSEFLRSERALKSRVAEARDLLGPQPAPADEALPSSEFPVLSREPASAGGARAAADPTPPAGRWERPKRPWRAAPHLKCCTTASCRTAPRTLSILSREGPGPLVAPATLPPTRIVEATVDSGAEDSVTPPALFSSEVVPSPMSKAGRRYRVANGACIPNLVQTVVHFSDEAGWFCGLPFQVAAVERPLIGVSRLAAAGHEVRFSGESGSILHVATGRPLPLTRKGGVYVLEMRLPQPASAGVAQPFARPGQ